MPRACSARRTPARGSWASARLARHGWASTCTTDRAPVRRPGWVEAYARRKGVTLEAFLASFGPQLTPAQVGEHVATLLTDPRYETGVAFGLRGDLGIHSLDG